MARKQREKPSARCIRCGERIKAEDMADVHAKYTQHVTQVHDMPSSGSAGSLDDMAVDDA